MTRRRAAGQTTEDVPVGTFKRSHSNLGPGHEQCPCAVCGCCCIGRMGTCVGGCGPRGGRSKHDRAAQALPASQQRHQRPVEALQDTSGVPEPSTVVLAALSEREFQKHVVGGLKRRGYVVWTFPEMRFTRAGVPDLIFWHPDRPGRLYCWELKRETKYRVSPDQRAALEHLSTVDGVDARVLRPSQWRVASEEV